MSGLENCKPMNTWFKKLDTRPIVISGPSVVESEEQLLNTARELKKVDQVKIFRAGVWKPQTATKTFGDRGLDILQWLNQVKQETGLLTMVEVASPKHVEMCLRHNVDILWIGARTTSNPFSIQELASALQGMNVPVMIKNPLNPDINLWIGALEQINKAGISRMAAIHCGFYPFEQTSLRNIPKWEIPIELKSRFHNLPMICDPSHIAGDKQHIQQISQKALDLNMDGLMIESHFKPEEALSELEETLSPAELDEVLRGLVCRLNSIDDLGENQLEQYRNQIDSVDAQLIELLAQRMNIVEEIGEYKSQKNMTILQLERWEKVREKGVELGKSLGLSEKFTTQLLRMIHKEAILKQNKVMNR
ncbi:bifunctional 3-deoxy-7-phosphoheptulonate synthase/chorismate mutase type II [Labilibaculum sp. DW002]|uniref:chorismate mutase n=1 Tax=Paralabilibaculum antarcticum TaxID=2912572 RepID=A0ABT5VS02_9BACT|nr:chorismate mutase [Labilibaculum sp. DW002]MDE5418210.1 bifunctional 3-deoxy-7-phosphoheptulonate synthase/chorismate mutase type II [Labilibaculum sp. DW002]